MCQMCDVATVAWVAQQPVIELGTVRELELRCMVETPATLDGLLDDGGGRTIASHQVLVGTAGPVILMDPLGLECLPLLS
jgi:hypothetical protein